jgi:hypothetical protein
MTSAAESFMWLMTSAAENYIWLMISYCKLKLVDDLSY